MHSSYFLRLSNYICRGFISEFLLIKRRFWFMIFAEIYSMIYLFKLHHYDLMS